MVMMHYVGLDVHRNRTSMEVLDADGKRIVRKEIVGDWDAVVREVKSLPRPLAVCYEASCGYGYLHERLGKVADRIEVAHPGQLRLIFRSRKKSDRVDAAKIAKLLYLDAIPQVHVPNLDVRQWRGLIEFRRRMLDKQTAVKNQLRAILRGNNVHPPRGLWYKKGLAWLAKLDESSLPPMQLLQRDLLTEELASLGAKIKRVETALAEIASKHPHVALLMTIPGVGIRTAEAFVAYVDDPRRFGRVSKVGSYVGLVPCQDASGDKNRLGHVTREGPPTVRKLLCEAAWQGVRRSEKMKAWFERIGGGEKDRRKIAVVAVARKLSVVMLSMMKSGQCWRA
jgi:transposase